MEEIKNEAVQETDNNEKKNRLGTASLILGLISSFTSIICIGIIPAILSIVFGFVCLTKKPDYYQKAFSIAGIILGILSFIILIALITLILRTDPKILNQYR